MLKQIPVDQSALGILEVVGVRPKMVRPDGGHGEPHQKGNVDGLPVWTIEALIRGGGEVESDILRVTVAASVAPSVEGPCVFAKLAAIPWNFNGKSGVAFVCDSVASASRNARPGVKPGGDD